MGEQGVYVKSWSEVASAIRKIVLFREHYTSSDGIRRVFKASKFAIKEARKTLPVIMSTGVTPPNFIYVLWPGIVVVCFEDWRILFGESGGAEVKVMCPANRHRFPEGSTPPIPAAPGT